MTRHDSPWPFGWIVLGLMALAFGGCADDASAVRVAWPAMGTVAAVQMKGEGARAAVPAARAAVQAEFGTLEGLLNAHDPKAEIRRLASLSDEAVLARCSPVTRPCYAAALGLMRASGGAFNPRGRGPDTLDLGAIAKGFAVDRASEAARNGVDALIDLGGNLKAVRGDWTTGVKNPNGAGVAAVVTLRAGEALATSATYFRGAHIFDGRTGGAVSNGVASVTVLCPSAMWADGLSTTLFVLGPEEGARFLRESLPRLAQAPPRVAALWILTDNSQIKIDPERRFQ